MGSRILVVDDDKAIRDFLFEALTRLGGYQVEVAGNAKEALERVVKEDFDLVLTDMKMPNMDGLQLIGDIAKIKPETLIVMMTGHGTIDTALDAMKRGASDYLTKPVNLDEMLLRLQRVFAQRERFMSVTHYAAELEKANQQLRKIDEIKSEFVSVASHELRTPLAAIKNAVQLMLQGRTGEINENQRKFLSMAERNINRLTGILNDLLDLSRIESGRIKMKFEEVDLKVPTEFILSSLRPQVEGKNIQLRKEIPDDLPPVYGDREKIERILTNLLGNALKFTPEGGEISVLARRSGEEEKMVVVSIKDSGVGIPPDQIDKIFEKFHQVENSLHRSVSGTGLGLAITKGLVEAHHGRIWAESEVEKGSTFTFTLPEAGGEMKDFHFRLILDTEFRKAQKNSTPLSLFVMEISNEAEVQDEMLLEQLEQNVKGCLCRNTDITVRQENEKFVASLCEADVKGAQVIRHRIEETAIRELMEASGGSFEIKIGSASYPEEAVSGQELLSMARERLRR